MNEILSEYNQLCKDFNQYEHTVIPLCAAENYVSKFCMTPLISNFEGKYSFTEASGNNSFIGGEYIERLNDLLRRQCKITFGANYVNTETLTGINCFTVCVMSLLSSEDYVLVTTPEQGGHASIPIILDTIGVKYDSVPYDYLNYQINYLSTAPNVPIPKSISALSTVIYPLANTSLAKRWKVILNWLSPSYISGNVAL